MATVTLVVDDEEHVRRSIVRILARAGHDCVEAADANEARAAMTKQEFDLVLCDVNMPGEGGLDLVKSVLVERADTAVLMVTGVDDPAIADVALEAGVYGYLLKPFTKNELLINVANALRRSALESENRVDRRHLVEAVRDRTEDLWNTVRRLEQADSAVRGSIEEMLRRISLTAELRDLETAQHIERMSRYSHLLARKLGLGSEECEQILLASRLHDVGKIGVPDRILRKKGKFTPEEYDVMKEHAAAGFRLLGGTEAGLLQLAATIAHTHHERWDGDGYPQGLAGEAIPLEGRIAAVADCFDALMSKRSYKPALPFGEVIEIMGAGRGTQFDARLLDVFLDSLEEFLLISQEPLTSAITRPN
jgi:putative two-component system response regulator